MLKKHANTWPFFFFFAILDNVCKTNVLDREKMVMGVSSDLLSEYNKHSSAKPYIGIRLGQALSA